MFTALILSAIGLSFDGIDARPAKAVVRKASLIRAVGDRSLEAPPPVVATGSYSLRDSVGQVWTHSDPDFLTRWVADRNAFLAADRVEAQAPYVQHYWAPVVHVRSGPFTRATRPVYVGGWGSYGSGACVGGSCAR